MNQPLYFLTTHSFMCHAGLHWIVLDLRRDKYLAIHQRDFQMLGPLLDGWSERAEFARRPGYDGNSAAATELAEELVDLGLLTKEPSSGRPLETLTLATPARPLISACASHRMDRSWRHAPALLLACARVTHMLRRWSLARIVRAIERRKRLNEKTASSAATERVRQLVLHFYALRPIYPRDYLCMFDSLALLEFLAPHGVYPDWVFGVRSDPFEAHCWIQSGDVLLNESTEKATLYQPIMCI